jgi:hypothetical protein
MILRFNKLNFTIEVKGEIKEAEHEDTAIAIVVSTDSSFLLKGDPLTLKQIMTICSCCITRLDGQKYLKIRDIYDIEF